MGKKRIEKTLTIAIGLIQIVHEVVILSSLDILDEGGGGDHEDVVAGLLGWNEGGGHSGELLASLLGGNHSTRTGHKNNNNKRVEPTKGGE